MSKPQTRLLSSTYAEGVPGGQARVRELAIALDEDDLREDGDGDLSRRLVAEPEPDRRMQAKVLARIAAEAAGDVAQHQCDLPPAADQTDVARARLQRRLQHAFIESVAAREDDDEIRRTRGQPSAGVRREIDAAHFPCPREALRRGEGRPIVDDDRLQPDLRSQVRDPLPDVAGAVEQQPRARAERLRGVAGGTERVAALAGRAASLKQLHRLLDDDGFERPAAHGAGDAAVRSDDHLRSRIAGRGPGGGRDGAKHERLASPAPAGGFREQLGVGEVHRALPKSTAAALPKRGAGKLSLAPPPGSRLQGPP